MIMGENTIIRTAEPDDARDMLRLYDPDRPRCALLNRHREPFWPTPDEVRELLAPRDNVPAIFFVIEDLEGIVRGYCALRMPAGLENFYGESLVLMHDDADYESPLATETMAWLRKRAFGDLRHRKLITHALDSETLYRAWLIAQGYESDGVQREVVYTQGRWQDCETLTLYNPALAVGVV